MIMHQGFFNLTKRIESLEYHAAQWIGTPWRENSGVLGSGVACHNLPRAIYVACGALPDSFPVVRSSPSRSKHDKVGVMTPFMDGRPEFARLELGKDELRAGDLLGLRICSCVDHFGVLLRHNVFVHVLMHKNVDFDEANVPPWSQRLLAVWRPL
jgi:cell wall-associated NlpC family hydrolase